jgi:hypothetical protein
MAELPDARRRRGAVAAVAAAGLAALPLRARGQTREVEGFRFEPTVRQGGVDLMLNGVGVRRRFFLSVYVAGLYVPQRSNSAETLLVQTGPRRMAMRFARDVEADLFMTSLSAGMAKHYSAEQLARWRGQIDTLTTVIRTMVLARRADAISWDYTPEDGGRIMQNSTPRLPAIPGEDFYNAVLRVWLGQHPADVDLKRGLLGS